MIQIKPKMVILEELRTKLHAYTDEVKLFFHAYGLGDLVVDKHIDHVAVKALNRKEYEQYLEVYLPLCKRLSYEQVNDRDLATAELHDELDAGTFGKVSIVEIMEPRPNAAVTTHDMIDHFEVLVESLEDIKQILSDKGVEFTEQENPAHKTVVIAINEWEQEVKFTDRGLLDIVNSHIANRTTLVHK